MKLTKQRLKEIIKEEIVNLREARYQEITISLDDFYKVQLISRKGRTALTKMDARIIISAVEKHIGGI